jgi:putative ABC transport system permease protein
VRGGTVMNARQPVPRLVSEIRSDLIRGGCGNILLKVSAEGVGGRPATRLGVLIGATGAAAGARMLSGMLFAVTPLDATTYVTVAVTMLTTAAVASYLPARRATRIDPLTAIRVG